jgi:hypothetical protein
MHVQFDADDDDGFEGEVVTARIYVDDCLILDGDLAGNRDGLLSEDETTIDAETLCAAAEACDTHVFHHPSLTVEADDCNGNTGSAEVQLSAKLHVNALCGTGDDESDDEADDESDDESDDEADDESDE